VHPDYRIESLGPEHRREHFSSGSEALDRYLREQAGQDARRRIASPFVLVVAATGEIAGYYTVSATSLDVTALPADLARKLPRHPTLPATLSGRLAVQRNHQGRGLSGALLIDAIQRAARNEIASYALVVDAKDERARAFYEHYGFLGFKDDMRRLFLPLARIAVSPQP
jgi:GNAT superfamily N-acetyltransferase